MQRIFSIRLWSVLLGALVLSGCAPDPAPKELNPLARWFWLNYEAADDEQIHEAIRNLHAIVGNDYTDDLQLSIDRLQAGDDYAPELSHKADLAKAAGVLLFNQIKCPIDKVEQLVISLDQKGLHGGYDNYERHYESNLDDYLSRDNLFLKWRSSYQITAIGNTYRAVMPGGTRWVKAEDEGKPQSGPAFLVRAYMPQPASTDDSDDYVRQNYQAQVYYELQPGVVMHMFADWRELKLGGFDSDGDIVPSTTLSTFLDGDEDIEDHCK